MIKKTTNFFLFFISCKGAFRQCAKCLLVFRYLTVCLYVCETKEQYLQNCCTPTPLVNQL